MIFLEDVRSEVFATVAMKNAVFWDVTLCGSCKNRCSGGTYRLVTMMMEAIRSSEISVLTKATKCNIPKDVLLRVARIFRQNAIFLGTTQSGPLIANQHRFACRLVSHWYLA
jgi:hypothetical protein